MRTLQLDGPYARYERLKHLPEAAEFGLQLLPQATTPFSVEYDAESRHTRIRLRSTVVAHVHLANRCATLQVRPEYPERYDHALLRAVRNAADLTDQIGKMIRQSKAEPSIDMALLTRTPVAFRTAIQDTKELFKALLGLEYLQPISIEWYNAGNQNTAFFSIWKSVMVGFKIRSLDGVLTHVPDANAAYSLEEASFNAQLLEGLDTYQARMDGPGLEASCRTLIDTTPQLDKDSIYKDYNKWRTENPRSHQLPAQISHGALSSHLRNGWAEHRYNGIRFGRNEIGTPDTALAALKLPMKVIAPAAEILMHSLRAHAIGKSVEDYPVISHETIAQAVENTDFGYDI